MREILFRGKTEKNEWVEGFYTTCYFGIGREPAIIPDEEFKWEPFKVDPDTVCEYTGLTDKNEKKIFEGDKIKIISDGHLFEDTQKIAICVYNPNDACFGLQANYLGAERFYAFCQMCNVQYEVIGNIYDNPELLKQGE